MGPVSLELWWAAADLFAFTPHWDQRKGEVYVSEAFEELYLASFELPRMSAPDWPYSQIYEEANDTTPPCFFALLGKIYEFVE